MTNFLYPFLIFITSFILVKGADLTIKSLKGIGKLFSWSPFVLSFIFVAISTSLPEIFVGVSSALHKVPQLSLGNIIGANIINLTLILGLCAIIVKKIKFKKIAQIETIFSLIASFCPIILAIDGTISQTDGLVLLVIFIIYVISIILMGKKTSQAVSGGVEKNIFKNFILLIVGLILLVGSAEIIIRLAEELAIILKIPLVLIGLILVSLGTTLPELILSLRAALKEQEELSLGTSLGTIVTNSCLALGLTTVIFPLQIVSLSSFFIAAIFFFLAIIIFAVFVKTREELSKIEGVFLVLFFIVFLVIQFLINR